MRPTPAIIGWLLPVAVSLVMATGCRLMESALDDRGPTRDDSVAATGAGPPPRRTIQLEVLFVRCAADDRLLRHAIWDHVDEQVIDEERRRALNANGLRAGVVTGDLPVEIATRLASSADDAGTGEVATADPARSRRRLQLLPGQRSEVVTATRLPSLVLLERCDGSVRGGTYHDATPLVAVEARPAADGRIGIEAVPEIKHGPVEKTWAGEDGMFRLETGQRRHRLDHLAIDVTLPAGGLLLVGCAGEPATTVGDALLRHHGDGEWDTVRLIAIRPLARSVDPTFAATDAPGDDAAK